MAVHEYSCDPHGSQLQQYLGRYNHYDDDCTDTSLTIQYNRIASAVVAVTDARAKWLLQSFLQWLNYVFITSIFLYISQNRLQTVEFTIHTVQHLRQYIKRTSS